MSFTAAAIQCSPTPGRASQNRHRSIGAIEDAAAQGARVVVLPELAISGYTLDRNALNCAAEPIDGPTVKAWHELASRLKIVVAGGFCESDGDELYNTAVLIGPGGLLLHYRKLHLFDKEKLVFAPGNRGLTVCDTPFGCIGLCVCYDLRFVEVARALSLLGAHLIAVPTAWVGGFDKQPRDGDGLIGQARGAIVQANLNQVYILCASQSGKNHEHSFLGSSLIADPYGKVLAGPLSEESEGASFCTIDLATVESAQQRTELVKPRQDRRTDVYRISLGAKAL